MRNEIGKSWNRLGRSHYRRRTEASLKGAGWGRSDLTDIVVVDIAELTSVEAKFVNLWEVGSRPLSWRRHSALPQNALERAVVRPRLSRYRAAYHAARDSRNAEAVISHLPRMTAAVADMSRIAGSRIPHLAFSFNFTALPDKLQCARMVKAFCARLLRAGEDDRNFLLLAYRRSSDPIRM